MQDPQNAFNEQIKERLKAEVFPPSRIPERFLDWAEKALNYESKQTLNCDSQTLLSLHDIASSEEKLPISLFEMGFLINAIESKSPSQLRVSTPYTTILSALSAMEAYWNEVVGPIKNSIMRRIQAQANISNGVPSHKQLIGKT